METHLNNASSTDQLCLVIVLIKLNGFLHIHLTKCVAYATDPTALRSKPTEDELHININYRIPDNSNVILTDLRSGSIYK